MISQPCQNGTKGITYHLSWGVFPYENSINPPLASPRFSYNLSCFNKRKKGKTKRCKTPYTKISSNKVYHFHLVRDQLMQELWYAPRHQHQGRIADALNRQLKHRAIYQGLKRLLRASSVAAIRFPPSNCDLPLSLKQKHFFFKLNCAHFQLDTIYISEMPFISYTLNFTVRTIIWLLFEQMSMYWLNSGWF